MTLAVHRLRAIAVHDRARPHEHRLLRRRWPRSGSSTATAWSTAFRRSLDIAGHVSWVPGGHPAQLRPARRDGAGRHRHWRSGLRAHHGAAAHVICHSGDAGWISGQALNGFNAAAVHHAPITFVMHRNGIQLSGTTRHIMNQDPRPIIASFGIQILEIRSLHDRAALFAAYRRGVQDRRRPAIRR